MSSFLRPGSGQSRNENGECCPAGRHSLFPVSLSLGTVVPVPAVLLISVLVLILVLLLLIVLLLILLILLILLVLLLLVLVSVLVAGHCNHLFSQLSMNAAGMFYTVPAQKIACCKPSAGLI